MKNYMNQSRDRRYTPYSPWGSAYNRMHAPISDVGSRSMRSNGSSCPLNARGKANCAQYQGETSRNIKNAPDTMPDRTPRIPSVEEGCGCGCGQSESDCAKIKKQLQTVDFALYEVILYLDAYPEHQEALNTYHMLLARRQKLIEDYESLCGPLTAFGNVSTVSWDWVKGTAPWEYPVD